MNQEQNNNDTILSISVSDTIKAKPDTAVISVLIGNADDNDLISSYEDASKAGAEKMAYLLSTIKNYGVSNDNFVVSALRVIPIYTNVSTKKELGGLIKSKETEVTYSRKLLGYSYSSSIVLKLPVENENITKIYCSLSSSDSAKKVEINYIIDNVDKWYDELVKKLIVKARHTAEVLAEASDMKVDKINHISMASRNRGFASPMRGVKTSSRLVQSDMMLCASNSFEDNVGDALEALADTEREMTESCEISFKLV